MASGGDAGREDRAGARDKVGKRSAERKNAQSAWAQFIVLGLLLFLFGFLSYEIIKPYLTAILWAIILAIVSYPLYSLLHRYVRYEGLAALINVVIILLLVVGPISYFMYLLVNELGQAVSYFQKQNLLSTGSPRWFITRFLDPILSSLGLSNSQLGAATADYIIKSGQKLAGQIPGHALTLIGSALNLVLTLIVLLFLPQKGPRLVAAGLEQIPFPRGNRERFKELVRDIIISTVYGTLFSAFAHGLFAFIIFFICRVPSPVLLGLTAGFTSLIPFFGSALVWLGVVIYLFAKGRMLALIVVALAGLVGAQLIEQLLKPLISKGRAKTPFLVVLFGILGGIEFFGFLGFVLGPLVLAIFIALLRFLKTTRSALEAV